MDITYTRSSSINTYKDCPHKYMMEYILGLPSKSGKKAMLGTIIHHVLELLARCKKTGHYKLNDSYIDTENLLRICWERYTNEDVDHSYDNADYKFCQTSIEKVMNSWYNPLKLNVVKTEQRFIIPVPGKDFSYEYHDLRTGTVNKGQFELRGTIDLITQFDKDTIEVIDWKTGQRKCWITGEEKGYELLQKDIQLKMYDLAVSLLYPHIPNRVLTIYYVNQGGPFQISFTDEEREETYEILKKNFHNIQNDVAPERLKEIKPKQKWKCQYVCHFGKACTKDGQSICDNIYAYRQHHGLDKTIETIEYIKKQKQNEATVKTSDRRNVY